MDYRPDYERAAILLAVSLLASIPTLLFLTVASTRAQVPSFVWLAVWIAAVFVCILPALIVVAHASSSFKIESGRFVHQRFSCCVRSIPIGEVIALDVTPGNLPGCFSFSDGTQIRVSGLALGDGEWLSRALRDGCPTARISGLSEQSPEGHT